MSGNTQFRLTMLVLSFSVPVGSLVYRSHVDRQQQRDLESSDQVTTELTDQAINLNRTLSQQAGYLEGVLHFIEVQEASGLPVAPEVLHQGRDLAAQRRSELKDAKVSYDHLAEKARINGLSSDFKVMQAIQAIDINLTTGHTQVEVFGSRLDSIEADAELKDLAQHLEDEETVYARTAAILSQSPGRGIQPNDWKSICHLGKCAGGLLERARRRVEGLNSGQIRPCCENHKQKYLERFDELQKRAKALQKQLGEIERGVADNKQSSAA